MKLQMKLFLHLMVQLKVHRKVHKGWDPSWTRRSVNYDESRQSIAGQEEDGSNCDPEQEERPEPKPRLVDSEADLESHNVTDTTATTKQDHRNDGVGDHH